MTDYTETVGSFGNGFDATQFNTSVLESTIVSTLISISNDGTTITFTFTPALSAPDVTTFDAIVLDMQTNGPDDIPETIILPGIELVNTTESTDISSGAMVVAGGAGIAKSINVGGSVTVGDVINTTLQTISTGDFTSPALDAGFAGSGIYENDVSATTFATATQALIIGDIQYLVGYSDITSGTSDYDIMALDKNTGDAVLTYGTNGTVSVPSAVATSINIPIGIFETLDNMHIVVIASNAIGNASEWDVLLRRYDNVSGTLDTSYGTLGTVTLNIGTVAVSARDFKTTQQNDSTVIITATATPQTTLSVYRLLLETGELDPTFGSTSSGLTEIPVTGTIAVTLWCDTQSDGSVILAGRVVNGSQQLFITKLFSNGVLDTGFASSGTFLDPTLIEIDYVTTFGIFSDDSICFIGNDSSTRVHAAKLTSDGIRDLSFADNGLFTSVIGTGHTCVSSTTNYDYIYAGFNNGIATEIVKFDVNGIDTTFGNNGYFSTSSQITINDSVIYFDEFRMFISGDSNGSTYKIAKYDDTPLNYITIDTDANVQGTVSTTVPPTLPKHLTNKNYIDDLIQSASPTGTRIKLLKSHSVGGYQSISSGVTTLVEWDPAEFNVNCTADSDGIIINEDGWYQIGYEVNLQAGINQRASWMKVKRNGVVDYEARRYAESRTVLDDSTVALWATSGTTIIELFAGDLVSVDVYHTHGSSRNMPGSSQTTYNNELFATKLSTPILPVVETTSVVTPLIDLTSTATSGVVLTRGTMVNDDSIEGGSGNLFQEFIASDGRTRHTINSAGEARWNLRDDTAAERGTFTIGTPAGGVGIILNEDDTPNRKNIYTLNKTFYITHEAATGVGPRLLNGQDQWSTTSDQRLKENIVECTGDLDKLSNIHGYCYNYIGDPTERVGVIAQEVQTQYPIAVGTIEGVDEASGLSDILVVKYTELIPNMINAINELNVIATDLKSRIETLESA
jgi:hypothetical protein